MMILLNDLLLAEFIRIKMKINESRIMHVTDADLRPNIEGKPTVSDIIGSMTPVEEAEIIILNGNTILKNRYERKGKEP